MHNLLSRLKQSKPGKWPWLVLTPVLFFIAVAIFGPWLSPYDPTKQDYGAILQ